MTVGLILCGMSAVWSVVLPVSGVFKQEGVRPVGWYWLVLEVRMRIHKEMKNYTYLGFLHSNFYSFIQVKHLQAGLKVGGII